MQKKKDINLISDMAVNKFKFAERAPIKYFLRAVVAGFFLSSSHNSFIYYWSGFK